MICPALYLFFDLPSYFASPLFYASIFIPYVGITLIGFIVPLKRRNYRLTDILQGQLLMVLSFPVYIKAAVSALLGTSATFQVTPKGQSSGIEIRENIVQLSFLYLNVAAIAWGFNRLAYESGQFWAIVVNMLWSTFHTAFLCSVFYFSNPEEKKNKTYAN